MDYEGDHLSQHLIDLRLPDAARAWLLDVWRVIQVLDDAADGDPVGVARAEDAALAVFLRMPTNAFWLANAAQLAPILALQVIKWRAANAAEAVGMADARSFMWRAGFYDLISGVCLICGQENDAGIALALYGENFDHYREEMKCQHRR